MEFMELKRRSSELQRKMEFFEKENAKLKNLVSEANAKVVSLEIDRLKHVEQISKLRAKNDLLLEEKSTHRRYYIQKLNDLNEKLNVEHAKTSELEENLALLEKRNFLLEEELCKEKEMNGKYSYITQELNKEIFEKVQNLMEAHKKIDELEILQHEQFEQISILENERRNGTVQNGTMTIRIKKGCTIYSENVQMYELVRKFIDRFKTTKCLKYEEEESNESKELQRLKDDCSELEKKFALMNNFEQFEEKTKRDKQSSAFDENDACEMCVHANNVLQKTSETSSLETPPVTPIRKRSSTPNLDVKPFAKKPMV